jgi:dihydrofolate reductase
MEAESLRHLRASDYVVLGRRTYELLYEAWGAIQQGAYFTQLKQQTGGDIEGYGSSTLVQTLMKHDLVDEYRIAIHPVVLGRGTTLLPQGGISASCSWPPPALSRPAWST